MYEYVTQSKHWKYPPGTKCFAWYSDCGRVTNLLFEDGIHIQRMAWGHPIMWATQYIQKLKEGETVQFRPHGNSMQGRIESGQLVTVAPIAQDRPIQVGDVVLCKVEGRQWLHLVKSIGSDGRYQIGNNKGHVNGWCTIDNVFGVVTAVES